MHYYRLLHPQISIEYQNRARRPLHGRPAERVYQLPTDRRAGQNGGGR